jgi:diguanylate cyclase (GGDEF)-like protein
VAERIRLKLSSFDKTSSGGQLPEPITISMGVFTATSSSVTAEECVESADKAMYEAKETGRNRVVVFSKKGLAAARPFYVISRETAAHGCFAQGEQ